MVKYSFSILFILGISELSTGKGFSRFRRDDVLTHHYCCTFSQCTDQKYMECVDSRGECTRKRSCNAGFWDLKHCCNKLCTHCDADDCDAYTGECNACEKGWLALNHTKSRPCLIPEDLALQKSYSYRLWKSLSPKERKLRFQINHHSRKIITDFYLSFWIKTCHIDAAAVPLVTFTDPYDYYVLNILVSNSTVSAQFYDTQIRNYNQIDIASNFGVLGNNIWKYFGISVNSTATPHHTFSKMRIVVGEKKTFHFSHVERSEWVDIPNLYLALKKKSSICFGEDTQNNDSVEAFTGEIADIQMLDFVIDDNIDPYLVKPMCGNVIGCGVDSGTVGVHFNGSVEPSMKNRTYFVKKDLDSGLARISQTCTSCSLPLNLTYLVTMNKPSLEPANKSWGLSTKKTFQYPEAVWLWCDDGIDQHLKHIHCLADGHWSMEPDELPDCRGAVTEAGVESDDAESSDEAVHEIIAGVIAAILFLLILIFVAYRLVCSGGAVSSDDAEDNDSGKSSDFSETENMAAVRGGVMDHKQRWSKDTMDETLANHSSISETSAAKLSWEADMKSASAKISNRLVTS